MYKKILSAVTALALVAGVGTFVSDVQYSKAPLKAFAEDYIEGTYGSLTYRKYADHVVISGCDKSVTEIVIPNEIEGLPVTEIGDIAFGGVTNSTAASIMTKITIPDSITKIGSLAFNYCANLTEITIPDSVTEIGSGAFQGCTGITKLTIPESVTKIESFTFAFCSNITSVTIPENVTAIGRFAFECCKNLTEIEIPDSVTSIESNAFYNCEDLTKITFLNPECEIDDISITISNGPEGYQGVICGYDNSTAQAYAEKYNYKFESLGEAPEKTEPEMGDIDGNGTVDSADATLVLTEYSLIQTGGESSLTPEQLKAADVNKDGIIDSSDASKILAYYADISTGKTPSWD